MAKLSFVAPRSTQPSAVTPRSGWLDSTEGELAFFRALIEHRPVGIHKHWAMLDVEGALKKVSPSESERIPPGDLWRKYGECFDVGVIESTTAEEDFSSPSPASTESTPSLDRLAHTKLPTRPTSHADFSLASLEDSDISFSSLLRARAQRSNSATASPPSEPLRDFSVPPGVVVPPHKESKGKGVATASPHKRRRLEVSKKAGPGSESSELSEVDSDNEEQDEEEAEEEASESASDGVEEAQDVASKIRQLPSSKKSSVSGDKSKSGTPASRDRDRERKSSRRKR
ncbi:hypothetical protein T439DRAFT_322124 [Meredithblackwellia eburnea MCA 4105]